MRALIAFDKFKDALSAQAAVDLAARALRAAQPGWSLDRCPLTDGGEGFESILAAAANVARVPCAVDGPRGGRIEAGLSLVPVGAIPAAARVQLFGRNPSASSAPGDDARVAIVEMAAASGLALLPSEWRDPWQTSSLGTGQLIRAAAELRASVILLGVGGSATQDLGLGCLSALGLEFRGANGEKLRPPSPAHWEKLSAIEGEVFPAIPPIRIACDVTNPLLGPRGTAAVYGPQKGLELARVPELEQAGARAARLLCEHCQRPFSLTEIPGAGAAGGIAFGLMCAAKAELLPGFELVSAWLDLERRIAEADIVITGEGRFDATSLAGKGPGAIAARALALGKRVHIFAGAVQAPEREGLALHAITPAGMPLDQALRTCSDHLIATVHRAFSETR